MLLPLLKKIALEEALYACVELGAHSVQLVITNKSQHTWVDLKKWCACNEFMIAAAEQSKNFAFPEWLPQCLLPEIVQRCDKTIK